MSDPAASPPGADLHRAYRTGGVRAALRRSVVAGLSAVLGAGLVAGALRELRPHDALVHGALGLALLALSAVHYASLAMAKVVVDGDSLRVRGVSGTVVIRADEIEGWHRDGTSAVLRLRRPGLRRIRLPARVRLDEEFFAWLQARVRPPA
ncbi:MAG TPA: hypothetical protein VLS93_06345 [Anaeromyxobacteraceae bacterium]|nr:hypothetical protein [Anaeromyxobacteraceae bacterium]